MSDNPVHSESKIKMFGQDLSIRGVIVVILTTTMCAMQLWGKKVEEPLYTLVVAACSWYFGQKGQQK